MQKRKELTILIRPEVDQNQVITEVKGALGYAGAKILKEEDDGRKRLAYAINGEEFANYYYFILDIDKDEVVKISNWLNTNDYVLRYLMVDISPKVNARIEMEKTIRDWVNNNFGASEAEDPSWNIEALATYIVNHTKIDYCEDEDE